MKCITIDRRGFTLIELLVVVSIVSLLSSIIFVSLSVARAKAQDTRKIADAAALRTAINLYINDKGKAPPTYTCAAGGDCTAHPTTYGIEMVGDGSGSLSDLAYEALMEHLVAEKYLSTVVRSPDDTPYTYTNYGPMTTEGGRFAVRLKARRSSGSGGSVAPAIGNSCQLPSSCTAVYEVEYDEDTGEERQGDLLRHDCYYRPPGAPETITIIRLDGVPFQSPATCSYTVYPDGRVEYTGGGSPLQGLDCSAQPRCVAGIDDYCVCNPY